MQHRTSMEGSERLWRKIQAKPNNEDEKSTQQSQVKTFKSQVNVGSLKQPLIQAQENKVKEEPDITEFLLQIHHKMSNLGLDSQSEIMERMSLDWPEESINRSQMHMSQKKSSSHQDSCILNQGWKTQRDVGSQLTTLREMKNLQELQVYLAGINPLISDQLADLMRDNQKLTEECNACKYNDKKTLLKIQLLNNQIHMMQKKNSQMATESQKLRQQLQSEKAKNSCYKQAQIGRMKQEQVFQQPQPKPALKISPIGQPKLSSSLELKKEPEPSPTVHRCESIPMAKSNSSLTALNKHDYHSLVAQIFRPTKKDRNIVK